MYVPDLTGLLPLIVYLDAYDIEIVLKHHPIGGKLGGLEITKLY